MVGLKNLEILNSIFNITEGKNKFELYTFDEFSFEEKKTNLRKSLVFQKFHTNIYQMKKLVHVLLKHIENSNKKRQTDG